MPSQDDPVAVYKELSEWYERRGEPPMRDRFLVLAADAAQRGGRVEDAERFRFRLLKLNPHHMLKPYTSFTQALQAPDVQTYIRDLRLNYPPEVALVLLHSLRSTGMKLDDTVSPSANRPHDEDDATVTLGDPSEQLKVFSDQHESDAPETAALPRHLLEAAQRPAPKPPQPKPPLPAARTPPSSHNVPRPQPAATPKKKAAPAPRPSAHAAPAPYVPLLDPDTTPGGGWFAVVLFILVCLTGLVLAGYIVARPFLP